MDKKKTAKQPVVRQTKSSIYRMAKANPLLVRENRIKVEDKNVFLPPAVVYSRRMTIDDYEVIKMLKQNTTSEDALDDIGKKSLDVGKQKYTMTSKWKPTSLINGKGQTNVQSLYRTKTSSSAKMQVAASNSEKLTSCTKSVLAAKPKQSALPKERPRENHNRPQERISTKCNVVPTRRDVKTTIKPLQNANRKPLVKGNNADNPKNSTATSKSVINKINDDGFKKPFAKVPKAFNSGKLRRSISTEHFATTDEKKTIGTFGSSTKTPNKSVSFQSLNKVSSNAVIDMPFSTFNRHRRSNVSAAPKSLPDSAYNRLQQPLKNWLKSRGKSLSNYHHLKCFGLQHLSKETKSDEDKENIGGELRSSCVDDLNISKGNQTDETPTENIVVGAIEDLHNLIVGGYPIHQCEPWLDFIRQKYKKIEEQPMYWECRAAIEQSRGNISSAVECYKNSIVKGANVDQIDESLSHLLEKFSLLNIETKNSPNVNERRKEKEEVLNIFKSTIIQFAIKERTMNMNNESFENQKKFVATPVRRSTRTSCGRFQHTPGKTMCNSLSELDSSIKESLDFKNNSYLA